MRLIRHTHFYRKIKDIDIYCNCKNWRCRYELYIIMQYILNKEWWREN